jgi:ATP:corrinoid adenosyltransferase
MRFFALHSIFVPIRHFFEAFHTTSMQAGFTWDTQDKEFDKKMALETWQQAEQYLQLMA